MKTLVLRGAALAVVLLGILAAMADDGPKTQRRSPHILLVTLDTTRTDHTSAYGYSRRTTPRLEQLADEGVRFEAAYAPMATTLPAHASLFTAELPRALGITRNGVVLADHHETLAEQLRASGYATAAFVSSFPVEERFGLGQGFEHYDDDFRQGDCPTAITAWEGFEIDRGFCRRGEHTTQRTLEWLETQGYLDLDGASGKPFFIWVHYFDPHAPYRPDEEDAKRFPATDDSWLAEKTAAYDGEIHYMDRTLGTLLDGLDAAGQLDDTLVIVAADHGEGLMQHGHMHHSLLIYEEDVRVPLIVRWPGQIAGGKVRHEPVQLADLTPTLLEIAGRKTPRNTSGISLADALLDDQPLDADRPIFLQRREYEEPIVAGRRVRGEKLGVRRGRWKYIEAPQEGTVELYDLQADPDELDNRARSNARERRSLAEALQRWRKESPSRALAPVDPESRERLRALGYVP